MQQQQQRTMPGPPQPVPHGVYFATFQPGQHGTPWRTVVEVRADGFGHTRVFMPRWGRGFNAEQFTDWSEPIVDPLAEKAGAV
jgi:hypothetical protein